LSIHRLGRYSQVTRAIDLAWRKKSLVNQLLTQRYALRFIHGENLDSGPTHRGFPEKLGPLPTKVLAPGVPPRVEEASELPGLRVYPGQVWSLVEVAPKASVSEVGKRVVAAVLFGDDMLDLEGRDDVSFRKATVLTTAACPAGNLLSGGIVHPWKPLAGLNP
jgi:hypothetical protein